MAGSPESLRPQRLAGLPAHHAGGAVRVRGTLLLRELAEVAEGPGGCPPWRQGRRGDPPWVWLSQRTVPQASCHSPDHSLELQGGEAQAKTLAIFAFTVDFMFLRREIAARTTMPSRAP